MSFLFLAFLIQVRSPSHIGSDNKLHNREDHDNIIIHDKRLCSESNLVYSSLLIIIEPTRALHVNVGWILSD